MTKIVHLHNAGFSYAAIGKRYGMSDSAASHLAKCYRNEWRSNRFPVR